MLRTIAIVGVNDLTAFPIQEQIITFWILKVVRQVDIRGL